MTDESHTHPLLDLAAGGLAAIDRRIEQLQREMNRQASAGDVTDRLRRERALAALARWVAVRDRALALNRSLETAIAEDAKIGS